MSALTARRPLTMAAHPSVDELRRLIDHGRVAMIGPVRQELLSRLRDFSRYAARLPLRLHRIQV